MTRPSWLKRFRLALRAFWSVWRWGDVPLEALWGIPEPEPRPPRLRGTRRAYDDPEIHARRWALRKVSRMAVLPPRTRHKEKKQ